MYGIEQKLKITRHTERYGTASCCDAFDVKARTLRRWRRLYREEGAMALSDGWKGVSGRKGGRQAPSEVISFIRDYRQDPRHLNAGAGIIKSALSGFCERRGYAPVSIATLSRIIADDKDKMRTAPLRLNRLGKAKPLLPKNSRHRKPKPLEAKTVGDVAAFDSVAYRAYGRRVYAITAIDLYSRIGFAMMFSSKSARSSAQVLRGMEAFLSAPIQTILSDNGSEFEGEFARVAADKGITRFYTHPNCPQQNAVNERFNRTVREAFLETHEDWIDGLQQMNEAPADWLTDIMVFALTALSI